jgi:hypothetical protein
MTCVRLILHKDLLSNTSSPCKQQGIATSNTARRDLASACLAGEAAAGLRGVGSIPRQANWRVHKHSRGGRNPLPHRFGSEGLAEA